MNSRQTRHSRAGRCMNCSGRGNPPVPSRSHCCLPGRRRKTAARLPGAIQIASFICRPCRRRESTFGIWSCCAARIARTSFGRWPSACAAAGVGATVAFIQRLSQIEARRLQLAAERGGGVGLFMRPYAPGISNYYAAATRWLIQPAPGSDQVQRWSVQLLHGHGGQIGKVLLLEVDRETRALRVSAATGRSTGCAGAGPSYGINRWCWSKPAATARPRSRQPGNARR